MDTWKIRFCLDVFEEVDTRGGYHDEMKTRLFLVDYQVYFSLLDNTDKINDHAVKNKPDNQ